MAEGQSLMPGQDGGVRNPTFKALEEMFLVVSIDPRTEIEANYMKDGRGIYEIKMQMSRLIPWDEEPIPMNCKLTTFLELCQSFVDDDHYHWTCRINVDGGRFEYRDVRTFEVRPFNTQAEFGDAIADLWFDGFTPYKNLCIRYYPSFFRNRRTGQIEDDRPSLDLGLDAMRPVISQPPGPTDAQRPPTSDSRRSIAAKRPPTCDSQRSLTRPESGLSRSGVKKDRYRKLEELMFRVTIDGQTDAEQRFLKSNREDIYAAEFPVSSCTKETYLKSNNPKGCSIRHFVDQCQKAVNLDDTLPWRCTVTIGNESDTTLTARYFDDIKTQEAFSSAVQRLYNGGHPGDDFLHFKFYPNHFTNRVTGQFEEDRPSKKRNILRRRQYAKEGSKEERKKYGNAQSQKELEHAQQELDESLSHVAPTLSKAEKLLGISGTALGSAKNNRNTISGLPVVAPLASLRQPTYPTRTTSLRSHPTPTLRRKPATIGQLPKPLASSRPAMVTKPVAPSRPVMATKPIAPVENQDRSPAGPAANSAMPMGEAEKQVRIKQVLDATNENNVANVEAMLKETDWDVRRAIVKTNLAIKYEAMGQSDANTIGDEGYLSSGAATSSKPGRITLRPAPGSSKTATSNKETPASSQAHNQNEPTKEEVKHMVRQVKKGANYLKVSDSQAEEALKKSGWKVAPAVQLIINPQKPRESSHNPVMTKAGVPVRKVVGVLSRPAISEPGTPNRVSQTSSQSASTKRTGVPVRKAVGLSSRPTTQEFGKATATREAVPAKTTSTVLPRPTIQEPVPVLPAPEAVPDRAAGDVLPRPSRQEAGLTTTTSTVRQLSPAPNFSRPYPALPQTPQPRKTNLPVTPSSIIGRRTPGTPISTTTVETTPESSGKPKKTGFVSKIKRTLATKASPKSAALANSPMSETSKHEADSRNGTGHHRFSVLQDNWKDLFRQGVPNYSTQDEMYRRLFMQTKIRAFIRGGNDVDEYVGVRRDNNGKMQDDPDTDAYESMSIYNYFDEEEAELDPKVKLANLMHSNQLGQLGGTSNRRWADSCQFFGIDHNKTGIDEGVYIFGIRTPLYQYQAFAVFWAMLNSRKVGGGIIADTPGLGKTLVWLAYIVVERQLNILWDEVAHARKTKSGLHLDAGRQQVNAFCPSYPSRKGKGWIPCPCVSSNITSRMSRKMGIRMAIVPASLIVNWRRSWYEHVDLTSKDLNMQLIVAHTPINSHLTMDEIAEHRPNVIALKAISRNQADDDARKDQDRFMVLTTLKSYSDFIKPFKYEKYSPKAGIIRKVETLQRDKGSMLNWKKGGVKQNLNIGIGVVDECHESIFKEKGRPGLLAQLPGKPFCWGLSGTPCDNSPRGIEGILWAMESQAEKQAPLALETGWEQHPQLLQYQYSTLDSIAKQWQSLLQTSNPDPAAVDNVLQLFQPFLETFIIRRDGEKSQWFGHPLTRLNAHTHRDIFLEHNRASDVEIENFAKKLPAKYESELENVRRLHGKHDSPREFPSVLRFDTRMRVNVDMRLFATVPYLAKLGSPPYNMKFSPEELALARLGPKSSVYQNHLDNVLETSPKLLWVRDFIRRMDGMKDVNGNEQKLVILTAFPTLAFILRLMIEKYVPDGKDNVGEIHTTLKAAESAAILEAFTDEMKESSDGVMKRKQRKSIKYLVGTTFILGSGQQLTRACNLILMEPHYQFLHEKQVYSRINRIGQKNPATFTYRLIDEGSEVEQEIIEHHTFRRNFIGKYKDAEDIPADYLKGDVLTETETRFSFNTGVNARRAYHSPEVSPKSFPLPPGHATSGHPPKVYKPADTSTQGASSANQHTRVLPRNNAASGARGTAANHVNRQQLLDSLEEAQESVSPRDFLPERKPAQEIVPQEVFDAFHRSIGGSADPGPIDFVPIRRGSSAEVLPLSKKLESSPMANAEVPSREVTPPSLNPDTPRRESTDWTPPSKTAVRETSL